jgi:hypothetical protein
MIRLLDPEMPHPTRLRPKATNGRAINAQPSAVENSFQ